MWRSGLDDGWRISVVCERMIIPSAVARNERCEKRGPDGQMGR